MPQTILVEQTVKRISPYPKRVQRRCKLQTTTDDRDDPHEARTGSADPELIAKTNSATDNSTVSRRGTGQSQRLTSAHSNSRHDES